ncbi:antibiotic resistance protein VanZ [Glutamicibacter uratoxydans]|uniref:Antibiotic resistance protein VanZ n=1 Tax=Glutamicibacter uratoxydans TaxID=43667 RepID=A0A4Y4DSE6_GLUUR|nr:VanZ family protein [Glutamicibacter uratoxydans]GED07557.1 antibiotic resistance protein VanZ [Glutamicibacter uratoxydans]
MQSPFVEVPVLPVVVPLGLVVFVLLAWRLKVKQLFSIPRVLVAAALGIYAAGIVGNTIFPIILNAPPRTEAWDSGIVYVPFADYELMDALTNMLVFVPLGILFALVLSQPAWWKVMLAVIASSLGIEATQLLVQDLFGGGHIADSSDLVSNVAGGALGYVLLRILMLVPGLAGFVDRFRWAAPAAAEH